MHNPHNDFVLPVTIGVNFYGHLSSVFGLAGGAKATLRSLTAAGLSVNTVDMQLSTHEALECRQQLNSNPIDNASIDIIHTNPNILKSVPNLLTVNELKSPLRIAYWAWELEEFPNGWESAFDQYDEIWCPSSYCAKALIQRSPIPVISIPHLPDWNKLDKLSKKRALLQQKQIDLKPIQFLCLFDFWSTLERKNPEAVIKAFKLAFQNQLAHAPNARLVLKSSNAKQFPLYAKKISSIIDKDPNIEWIDTLLSQNELENLYLKSDVFISLHRAEGFGLCIADAMASGLTVIATGYSGNLEFMPIGSAHLVPWHYTSIKETTGDYPIGAVWAEPCLDYVVNCMLELVSNIEATRILGWAGHKAIKEILNSNKICNQIHQRIGTLLLGPSRRELLSKQIQPSSIFDIV